MYLCVALAMEGKIRKKSHKLATFLITNSKK